MRQRPLAIPRMKAGEPRIRQARHCDNAARNSEVRNMRGDG